MKDLKILRDKKTGKYVSQRGNTLHLNDNENFVRTFEPEEVKVCLSAEQIKALDVILDAELEIINLSDIYKPINL